LAGDPDFAVASAAGLAGAEDAEIDGAGVAGCVVAEDAGAEMEPAVWSLRLGA